MHVGGFCFAFALPCLSLQTVIGVLLHVVANGSMRLLLYYLHVRTISAHSPFTLLLQFSPPRVRREKSHHGCMRTMNARSLESATLHDEGNA